MSVWLRGCPPHTPQVRNRRPPAAGGNRPCSSVTLPCARSCRRQPPAPSTWLSVLISGDLVLLEQLADSVDKELRIGEILIHSDGGWTAQARLVQLFASAAFGQNG